MRCLPGLKLSPESLPFYGQPHLVFQLPKQILPDPIPSEVLTSEFLGKTQPMKPDYSSVVGCERSRKNARKGAQLFRIRG